MKNNVVINVVIFAGDMCFRLRDEVFFICHYNRPIAKSRFKQTKTNTNAHDTTQDIPQDFHVSICQILQQCCLVRPSYHPPPLIFLFEKNLKKVDKKVLTIYGTCTII